MSTAARPAVGRLFLERNQTKLPQIVAQAFPGGYVEAEALARFGLTLTAADIGDLLWAVYFPQGRIVWNTRLCQTERQRRFVVAHEIGHHLIARGHIPWAQGEEHVEAVCDGVACLALGLGDDELALPITAL